jgi:hypothetical protein
VTNIHDTNDNDIDDRQGPPADPATDPAPRDPALVQDKQDKAGIAGEPQPTSIEPASTQQADTRADEEPGIE